MVLPKKEDIVLTLQFYWLHRERFIKWIGLVLLAFCSIVFLPMLYNYLFTNSSLVGQQKSLTINQQHGDWIWDLLFNLLGYATVLLPACLLKYWLIHTNYFKSRDFNCWKTFLWNFFLGKGNVDNNNKSGEMISSKSRKLQKYSSSTNLTNNLHLMACAFGLLLSYLTWGVLQEKVMTLDYDGEKFHDSQFLVFVNRILGGIFALAIVLVSPFFMSTPTPEHKAPILDYVYSSLSNILSSWFQYEALKFVSFPTQVLAKASKIIPVMLMGKLISRKSYKLHEYGTAGLISIGVALFLLTSESPKTIKQHANHAINESTSSSAFSWNAVNTFSGVFLLMGYMVFDSFTSNWQDKLFKQYAMSSLQMMAYTNLWSCVLTVTSLFEKSSLSSAFEFGSRHPRFVYDITLLSLCSAVGQLFIFHTIGRFGAVTFIIIMTLRQAVAILLSCLLYSHHVSSMAFVGICIVFVALFIRIYLSHYHATSFSSSSSTSSSTASRRLIPVSPNIESKITGIIQGGGGGGCEANSSDLLLSVQVDHSHRNSPTKYY